MIAKKNILITGASGFVGKHLVQLGLEKGYSVLAMVRKTSNTKDLEGARIIYGDVTEYDLLVKEFTVLKNEGITLDYIIHAAALTKSNSKTEMYKVNYKGTFNLYTALEQVNYVPVKIIFISSLAACGPAKFGHTISKGFEQPITTYGKSKLEAEKFITFSTQIPSVIVRPTAVYGPGEKDLFSVFKLIKKGLNPLLGSHSQALTFIYVKDLTQLIFTAIEKAAANKIYFATDGQVYDKYAFSKAIATSLNKQLLTVHIPLPVIKVIAFIAQHTSAILGKTSPLSIEKYNELVAGSWSCDISDTIASLDYKPAYDIKTGINETTNWYKKNKWI